MRKDELRALLDRAGVRPWRGHGQNFLVDDNLAEAIARDGTERVADEQARAALAAQAASQAEDTSNASQASGAQASGAQASGAQASGSQASGAQASGAQPVSSQAASASGAAEGASAPRAPIADAKGDVVLEVGTGPGILTVHLLPRAKHVVTVEIEPKLEALAREVLGAATNVTFVLADALASKSELSPAVLDALRPHLAGGARLRVCANLPYAVATPLLIALLAADLPLASAVVMVQLEAAERFVARPGDEQYGAVSVLTRAACSTARIVRKVPPEVFHPRPKVHSAILRLDPAPGRQQELARMSDVVRALFNYRRKTVGKAAKLAASADPALAWLEGAIGPAGVDARVRPEDLDVDAFRALAARRPDPSTGA